MTAFVGSTASTRIRGMWAEAPPSLQFASFARRRLALPNRDAMIIISGTPVKCQVA